MLVQEGLIRLYMNKQNYWFLEKGAIDSLCLLNDCDDSMLQVTVKTGILEEEIDTEVLYEYADYYADYEEIGDTNIYNSALEI